MKTKINLIISTLDQSELEGRVVTKILSLEKQNLVLPYCLLEENNKDKTLKEIYYNLFSLYILEINPKWIEIRLLDIEKDFETNTIDVYYVCSIPIESRLKNAYFINNNQTLVSHIIQKASRYS